MRSFYGWALLLLVACVRAQDKDAQDQTYIAAVFEHARVGSEETDSLEVIVEKNLDIYATATEAAAKRNADIIVFPDYGLFPSLRKREKNVEILENIPAPNSSDPPHPCNQPHLYFNRPILTSLSCMARDHGIYVVAGMGGIQSCSNEVDANCPSDGAYHLNALVAFDRKGYLLARYYKDHLFFERTLDRTPQPQSATFDTEFGKFAMISSFDLLFNNSVEAVELNDAENFIFSTQWFDELPFLTSIQAQEMFAVRMGVNVLAANLNLPYRETLGSGIYSCAKGAIRYTYNPDGISKLLIARIPKQPGLFIPEEQFPILMIHDGQVTEYEDIDGSKVPSVCSVKVLGPSKTEYRCNERDLSNFLLKKLTKAEDNVEICTNSTCCSLQYKIVNESFVEDYYIAAYKGDMVIENRYKMNVETCSVVRCDSIEDQKCATFPLKSETIFDELQLSGTVHDKYVFPSVVLSGQRLGPAKNWEFKLFTDKAVLKFIDIKSPLLVANLFGRCYVNDPPYDMFN